MTLNLKEPLEYYDPETGETAPSGKVNYRNSVGNMVLEIGTPGEGRGIFRPDGRHYIDASRFILRNVPKPAVSPELVEVARTLAFVLKTFGEKDGDVRVFESVALPTGDIHRLNTLLAELDPPEPVDPLVEALLAWTGETDADGLADFQAELAKRGLTITELAKEQK